MSADLSKSWALLGSDFVFLVAIKVVQGRDDRLRGGPVIGQHPPPPPPPPPPLPPPPMTTTTTTTGEEERSDIDTCCRQRRSAVGTKECTSVVWLFQPRR
eukprot:342999-Hanusia_phi.AAC.1